MHGEQMVRGLVVIGPGGQRRRIHDRVLAAGEPGGVGDHCRSIVGAHQIGNDQEALFDELCTP